MKYIMAFDCPRHETCIVSKTKRVEMLGAAISSEKICTNRNHKAKMVCQECYEIINKIREQ